jgi:hypothetical protein
MIAAKYEEIFPPLLKEIVHVGDGCYTEEQVLETEIKILLSIDFDI